VRHNILIVIALMLLASCANRPAAPTHPAIPSATPTIAPTPTAAPTSAPGTPSPTLKPPDSDYPAAGICATAQGAFAVVVINPDTPSPRCQHIAADQRLRIINRSGRTSEVRLAHHALTLPPQAEGTIDQPFGDYLAPGVHTLIISTYAGGGGSDLWFDR
jgi:hypothetical protein